MLNEKQVQDLATRLTNEFMLDLKAMAVAGYSPEVSGETAKQASDLRGKGIATYLAVADPEGYVEQVTAIYTEFENQKRLALLQMLLDSLGGPGPGVDASDGPEPAEEDSLPEPEEDEDEDQD